jgi:hypothetical protein
VPKKVKNSHSRQPTSDNVVNGHPQALGNPQVTLGSSMVVDGSLVSSVSSENSVEESSFRQLQDAVSQV